jgi:hypothetical protein
LVELPMWLVAQRKVIPAISLILLKEFLGIKTLNPDFSK